VSIYGDLYMKKRNLFILFNFFMALQLVIDLQAFASRGGDHFHSEPPERNFSHREYQPNNAYHEHQNDRHVAPHATSERSEKSENSEKNSLARAHNENVSAFSNQHLKMNPHAGIPNKSNNQSNNSATNNGSNNNSNNNNNTYNYYGNSGWNGNNDGGGYGWGGGLAYGALFGATLSTALVTSYALYNYPVPNYAYYPSKPQISSAATTIPQTASTSAATPNDETWQAAENGTVPNKAVINNTENGKTTYYCRTTYNKELSYGVLVPNDGCYIETATVTMRFTTYDVLTKK